MFVSNLILQTEKIVLRPMVEDDFKFFVGLTDDPSMWVYPE